ncbi:MAG: hypothetical protein APF81_06225 [Desulfosporosinus sp. BRH_c37]|nr:MAG: hypothetical protein APF81_06225 [Desulfosporosinus sp. BRH_c37]
MKDYYSILGINEYATTDEIKMAFRRLMKIWHPDISSQTGSDERFKEIVEAYEILNDQYERNKYDEKRKEIDLEAAEEHPTTLFGCLFITFLIIISLSFVVYIAFNVYTILHGVSNNR